MGTIGVDIVLVDTSIPPRRNGRDVRVTHDHLPEMVDTVICSIHPLSFLKYAAAKNMLTLTSMQDPVNGVHLIYVRIKAFPDVIL